MFVNAILHHEVLVFYEKPAKFIPEPALEPARILLPLGSMPGGRLARTGIKSRLMSEPHRPGDISVNSPSNSNVPPAVTAPSTAKNDAIFASKPPEGGGIPIMAWGVAGLAVLVVILILVLGERHKAATPATIQPLAPYAANLPLSQLAMSESTSLSGGKSTFIDGHIQNIGNQTVTGITVQVLFRNNEAMPPQIETMPLSLIRTREPYIDTQPVSSAPLKPGDERDFRLIFESLPPNWNMQMPEIRIIQVDTK
jgi:hypothetical protein